MKGKILVCAFTIGSHLRYASMLQDNDILIDVDTDAGGLGFQELTWINQVCVSRRRLHIVGGNTLLMEMAGWTHSSAISVHAKLTAQEISNYCQKMLRHNRIFVF